VSVMGECVIYVYYESRKRELKIRLMNEGRCKRDGLKLVMSR
jgi:hypothetical protein